MSRLLYRHFICFWPVFLNITALISRTKIGVDYSLYITMTKDKNFCIQVEEFLLKSQKFSENVSWFVERGIQIVYWHVGIVIYSEQKINPI